MTSPDEFTVMTDELDEVIADLEVTEAALDAVDRDLTSRMGLLHESWEGQAAEAHAAAHAEWTEGLREMRRALQELRAAARSAHGNYTGAAEANVSMWEQLL
jgi:WXG100 family type VII secretion target